MFLIVRIVFFVFSIMFSKTSLLSLPIHLIIRCKLCFLLTHSVVPYIVLNADCDSIICVSNYVLPDPGLQGDRPL